MRAPLRVAVSDLREGELDLDPATSHYVAVVRRLRRGAALVLFDPERGLEADAEIVAPAASTACSLVRVQVGAAVPAARGSLTRIVVLQALAKGDKMDAIVRDATELGADAIWPIETERSVRGASSSKLERWHRIARDAARQSVRALAPEIRAVDELANTLRELSDPPAGEVRLMLHPTAALPLAHALRERGSDTSTDAAVELAARGDVVARRVLVAIGPEGGFSPREHEAFLAAHFVPARLGAFVLRTETACAAALGAIVALEDALEDVGSRAS